MQIQLEHLDAESAWQRIIRAHERYHTNLKNYKYSYEMFIPNDDRMREMFEQSKLTEQQIQHYHDIFVKEIYKLSDLTHKDADINSAIQRFQNRIKTLIAPLLPAWNATMPETLSIKCTYGYGGGYSSGRNATILFRMSRDKRNDYGIYLLLMHEFVHILIEEQIIGKYNVPQDLKERIVDIIGLELFNKPIQQMYENSFANSYITPEVIKTDLESAVKKMMADYTALKQAQNTPDI
ncbi:MAG: hypothetical protein J6R22_05260 [Alphaproteobacteria bacterium]|nr:hypothetical protein [Alphaproteobacteria bacterium]